MLWYGRSFSIIPYGFSLLRLKSSFSNNRENSGNLSHINPCCKNRLLSRYRQLKNYNMGK